MSFHKTNYLVIILSLFVLVNCGGGGDDGASSQVPAPNQSPPPLVDESKLPKFLASQLLAQQNAVIKADTGGVVELNGASLSAPANALDKNVLLGLATVAVSANDLPADDGARMGLKVVSPEAYLLFSDEDVDLNQPLTLRLPIDPTLLPEEIEAKDIQLASQMGGFLIPMGTPTRVDLDNNFVEVDLDIPRLLAYGADQIMREAPRAASAEFLAVMAGLATTPWTWNAILVAINDATSGRSLTKRVTPHFTIFMDEKRRVNLLDVIVVENALEKAYGVFVGELGMSLPNLFNLDGRYSVVIDDLTQYSLLPLPSDTPEGLTLAGSSIIEGISYIHTGVNRDQMKNVAVHEYFHALQWGALTSPFIWNVGDKKIDQLTAAQSGWLFEGSAVALAGRIIEGDVVNAARDSDFDRRMPQGVALFASEITYGMAHDVAQDFFFYLERTLGDYDFYPDIFDNISPLRIFDNRETAVRATDVVIQDYTSNNLDMSQAWENFVVDYWVDNFNLYSKKYSIDGHPLDDQTSQQQFSYTMPALSQRVFSLDVPALAKDAQGNILPDQATDIEIDVTMTTNDGSIKQVPILIVDELSPNAVSRYPWFASSLSPRSNEFRDFREEKDRKLYFVMSYPKLDKAASANLSFTTRLVKPDSDDSFNATVSIPGISVSFQPHNYAALATRWPDNKQTIGIVASEGESADSEYITITFNPNNVTGAGTYSLSADPSASAALFVFSSPALKHANVGERLDGLNVSFSAQTGSFTINDWSTQVGGVVSGSFSVQVLGIQVTGKDDEGNFINKAFSGTITGNFSVEVIAAVTNQ